MRKTEIWQLLPIIFIKNLQRRFFEKKTVPRESVWDQWTNKTYLAGFKIVYFLRGNTMTYETVRLLSYQSYQHWISEEVFSFRWFVIVGVLAAVYAVWLKLLDKRRVKDILLFGSLLSIGYVLADVILGSFVGFYAYRISIFPIKPSIFIVSITIAPIMFMLVLQYTSSWPSFMLWGTIGTAVLSFGLVPLYVHMDILQLYKGWNYSLSFLRTFTGGNDSKSYASLAFRHRETSSCIKPSVSRLFRFTAGSGQTTQRE
jgi:hypothetical protein